ncbi:hypothetical protein ACLB2K_033269 [Fragaria x ananassa]
MIVLISSQVLRTFLFLFFLAWITKGDDLNPHRLSEPDGRPMVFNVLRYGAVADGRTDNRQAFLKAWSEACNWDGRARVVIPSKTFKLFPVLFSGPCKGRIAFIIKGTLLASNSPSAVSSENWINFENVNQLTVSGGGTLDAQGPSVWSLNDCKTNPGCKALPIFVSIMFVELYRHEVMSKLSGSFLNPLKPQTQLTPTATTTTRAFNAIINRLSSQRSHHEVLATFSSMLKVHIPPDTHTFPSLLKACTSLNLFGHGVSLHQCVVVNGFFSDAYIASSLINLYAKLGHV